MRRRNSKLKLWLFGAIALTAFLQPSMLSAQEVSIRSNLLWVAAAEPNVGLEWQTGDHWSVGVECGLKAWPRWLAWDWDSENTTHWRNYAVSPEVRYYFNEVFRGFYTSADAFYSHFNVGNVEFPFGLYPELKDNRLQGSYWAGALSMGYAWWPWQHWRVELSAGVAGGLAAYDRFECPTCGTKLGEEKKALVMPKLALNLAYNFVSRTKHDHRKAARNEVSTDVMLNPPVAFVVQLQDVKAPETVADRLAKKNTWVIPIANYRPLDRLAKPDIDSLLCVNYELNSDLLKREYRQNAQVLDRIKNAVETIYKAETTDELLISIVGLASIEGPQRRNDTLSVRRARAVAQYLNQYTHVSSSHFEIIGKGEAWDWFRNQLNTTDPRCVKLLDIICSEPDADVREQKIKADAALYAFVKENYLSNQRNSGYIRVYYSNKPDEVTLRWNGPVMDMLKNRRYRDVVKTVRADESLFARVKEDAEAANAYGVALYFVAQEEDSLDLEQEAIMLLEKAERNGSTAAAQNLKGIETYDRAYHEYQAWKKLMEEQ